MRRELKEGLEMGSNQDKVQMRGFVVRAVYRLDDLAAGLPLVDDLVGLAHDIKGVRFEVFTSLETEGLIQLYENFEDEAGAEKFRADPRIGRVAKAWREIAVIQDRSEWRGVSLTNRKGVKPQPGDYFVNPRLRAKSGEFDAIVEGLRRDVIGMQNAERIVNFELNVSRTDPLNLMFSARWPSKAHWEAHQDQIDYPAILARIDGPLVRTLWVAA